MTRGIDEFAVAGLLWDVVADEADADKRLRYIAFTLQADEAVTDRGVSLHNVVTRKQRQ